MTNSTKRKKKNGHVFYIFILIFSLLSILFFKYFPFVFVEGEVLITLHLMLAYYSLMGSRYSFIAAIGNIAIGFLGILSQPYFALHIFSYNIIHYIWIFYLGSGAINVVFYFVFLLARKVNERKNKTLIESV